MALWVKPLLKQQHPTWVLVHVLAAAHLSQLCAQPGKPQRWPRCLGYCIPGETWNKLDSGCRLRPGPTLAEITICGKNLQMEDFFLSFCFSSFLYVSLIFKSTNQYFKNRDWKAAWIVADPIEPIAASVLSLVRLL